MIAEAYGASKNTVESEALANLKRLRPRMFALLEECARVQTRKAREYASDADPYSNYRAAGAHIGKTAYEYVEMRLAEKMERQSQLMQKGIIEESEGGYRESAIDRANCVLIACDLYEQALTRPLEVKMDCRNTLEYNRAVNEAAQKLEQTFRSGYEGGR